MAKYKRFKRYARRARNTYNRAYIRGRMAYDKSGLNINMYNGAGILAAFAVPQNTDIDMAAIMIAAAPVRGLGKFKGFAQGYIFGQALQHWLLPKAGIVIPDVGAGLINSATGAVRTGNYL